jgi:hypothetical protein
MYQAFRHPADGQNPIDQIRADSAQRHRGVIGVFRVLHDGETVRFLDAFQS